MWIFAAVSVAFASAPDPSVFARKYLVIVGTEKEASSFGSKLAHLEPFQLDSTDFSGLKPCWKLLVAKAFPDKAQAVAHSQKLAAQGIESYVRGTGAYVGDAPGHDAVCEPGPTSHMNNTGAWMISDKDALMGWGSQTEEREEKLEDTDLYGLQIGSRLRVVRHSTMQSHICTVTGFYSLDRSVDGGFGRCGTPDLVARLDPQCPSGDYAVPEGAREPILYRETPTSEQPALEEELKASPEYRDTKARFSSEKGFSETLSQRAWQGPSGTVIYLQADLSYPVEHGDCDRPGEVTARVSQAWLLRADGRRQPLETPDDDDATIEAYVDLQADGLPEPLVTSPATRHLWGTAHPDHVAWCGCGC